MFRGGVAEDEVSPPVLSFRPVLKSAVWSTGWKMHSFLRRMQFAHRPCGSSGIGGRHLIFLLRQCPTNRQRVRQQKLISDGLPLTTRDCCSLVTQFVPSLITRWRG